MGLVDAPQRRQRSCECAPLVFGLVVIGLSVAASIVCLTMCIVFSYDITLTYPDAIVNVANTTDLETGASILSFYLRCDRVIGGPGLENLLLACGQTTYSSLPKCNILSSQGYGQQQYAYGALAACPTGYLQAITATVNLDVNYVALAVAMCALGIVLVWIPVGLLAGCTNTFN